MTTDQERVAAALPAYEVGRELGRGAFGVVWAAEHRRVGRRAAIKQLAAPDAAARVRFLAEAKVLASLEHPHIVPLYDYVEDGELCLLVMERLDGGTLTERFLLPRKMDVASACAVAMVTCAALHHAHRRGVLHRDVKPDNLMFSADGTLKVTDFGIAKVVTEGAASRSTALGTFKGTPAYMAPEQVAGDPPGPGVDIYATGLLLFELLTGELPFSDEGHVLAVALRRINDEPRRLELVAPELAGPLADVTMQALQRAPTDRFPTAQDFGIAIGQAATAVLGAGWLNRAQVALLATGPIFDSAHVASPGGRRPTRETVVVSEATGPGATVPDSDTLELARPAPAPAPTPAPTASTTQPGAPAGPPADTPPRPPGDGGSELPAAGRRRPRTILVLAGAVAVLAAVVVGLVATGGGGGTTTTASTTLPATGQPTAAEGAAAKLAVVLRQSNNARNVVIAAFRDVGNCTETPKDGIAQMQIAIADRVTVIANLKTVPAAALPNGAQMVAALNQAEQSSVETDRHYIDWMTDMQNAGTCPISATDPAFKAAAASSAKATVAKQMFVTLWNPVALQFNFTRYSDGDL